MGSIKRAYDQHALDAAVESYLLDNQRFWRDHDEDEEGLHPGAIDAIGPRGMTREDAIARIMGGLEEETTE